MDRPINVYVDERVIHDRLDREYVGILFLTQHLLNEIAFRHNTFQFPGLLHQEGADLFSGHLLRRMSNGDSHCR